MIQSRADRIKADREKKRRRLRRIMVASGALLTVFLIAAVGVFVKMDANQPAPNPNKQSETGQKEQSNESNAEPGDNSEPVVQLSFVGDVLLDGHVETLLKEKGYAFPYTHVADMFQQDDYTIANLETPVTQRGNPVTPKQYVYKSPPEAIPALREAGVDLVNLANNHSMDQGQEGLLDTISVLNENEIQYVGAGADAKRAYAPVVVERNGVKMAFLGFSRVVPEVSWHAGKNKPGVAATYDPTDAVEAIRSAKKVADLVIVIAHWGKEKVDHPVDHQKKLSRAYIDAGADLIIGGHPHVLQGFESYQGKWIAYSLGNFIFTRSAHPKTWETIVLKASCTKNGDCNLQMQPYHAELGQAVPMDQEAGAKLLDRIESISANVRIERDGSVRKAN